MAKAVLDFLSKLTFHDAELFLLQLALFIVVVYHLWKWLRETLR